MKKLLGATATLALLAAPVAASDLEAYCVEYTEANSGDSSGCACLADKADDTMADELMAISSDADLEALSDASKEAIAACWPDA